MHVHWTQIHIPCSAYFTHCWCLSFIHPENDAALHVTTEVNGPMHMAGHCPLHFWKISCVFCALVGKEGVGGLCSCEHRYWLQSNNTTHLPNIQQWIDAKTMIWEGRGPQNMQPNSSDQTHPDIERIHMVMYYKSMRTLILSKCWAYTN